MILRPQSFEASTEWNLYHAVAQHHSLVDGNLSAMHRFSILTGHMSGVEHNIGYTSSTAQGGGGSSKNRKPIGEVGCCESGMAERIHWWTERCLRSPTLSRSFSHYLPTYLSTFYVSIYLSIYLSLSLSSNYLSIYLSIYLSVECSCSCSDVECSVV